MEVAGGANLSAAKSDGDGANTTVQVCGEFGCSTYQLPADDPNAQYDGSRPLPPLLLPPPPPVPADGSFKATIDFSLNLTVDPLPAPSSGLTGGTSLNTGGTSAWQQGCSFDAVGCTTGRYAPGMPDGDGLLAHELVHVVQQEGRIPDPD